jgi:hypothetical protein
MSATERGLPCRRRGSRSSMDRNNEGDQPAERHRSSSTGSASRRSAPRRGPAQRPRSVSADNTDRPQTGLTRANRCRPLLLFRDAGAPRGSGSRPLSKDKAALRARAQADPWRTPLERGRVGRALLASSANSGIGSRQAGRSVVVALFAIGLSVCALRSAAGPEGSVGMICAAPLSFD